MKKKLLLLFIACIVFVVSACSLGTSYVLSFETNNGSKIESVTLSSVKESNIQATEKEGYVFSGWYLDNELTNKVTYPYKLRADTTFYALWLEAYTITFLNYDSTVLKTEIVGKGNSATAPIDFVKPSTDINSYVFDGWDIAFDNVNEDLTVTAIFREETLKYTISFNYNDATEGTEEESIQVQYNGTYGILPVPAKRAYVFSGWFKENDFINLVDLNTLIEKKNHTLYAKFTYNNKTVYTVNGWDAIVENEKSSILGYYGNLNIVTIPEKINNFNVTKLINLDNDSITKITISSKLSSVNFDAFNSCDLLSEILGDNIYLTTEDGVLYSKDKSILYRFPIAKETNMFSIPESVTIISSYAFGNCNINKFYLSVSVPPEIALNSFYNMTEYVIYVDADNVDTYKNDSCWSVYSTNITAKLLVGNGFIPYISEFTSNDIIIDSYEELQAYIEFISFNYITAETRTTGQQSIEITYIANSQISDEIDNAIKLSTFANNSGIGYSTNSTTYSFYISHDNRSSEASLTAATTDANKQIGNMIYEEIESTRASDFDDFKVNNKVLTVDVATSNQLLYVLEHGYVPLAEVGSNAELMYNKAKDVLKDIITDDMSDYEKVKAIYMWLVMDVAYDYDVLDLNTIEWWNYDAYYLEGVFNNERAVCDGISKAFSVLANIEGISAVRVAGTSLQGGHAWNKVLIDELWYVIDATWGGGKLTLNDVGYEALDFNDFMITELEKQNTFGCQGDTYNELLSNSEFDFYDNTSYTVSDYNFDLLIDNEEELSYLLEYYNNYYIANSMNYDYISLEFKINFEIGSSIGDEINNAKYLLGGRGIHLTNSSYFISGTATLGGIMSIIFY